MRIQNFLLGASMSALPRIWCRERERSESGDLVPEFSWSRQLGLSVADLVPEFSWSRQLGLSVAVDGNGG
jgi:hypothetical protein